MLVCVCDKNKKIKSTVLKNKIKERKYCMRLNKNKKIFISTFLLGVLTNRKGRKEKRKI